MRIFASLFGNRSLDTQLLTLVADATGRTIQGIEKLLERGANPNAVDYRAGISEGCEGQTCLHYACDWPSPERVRLVQALLDAGANARAASRWKHTPLHYFAMRDYIDEMQLLVNAGADVNAFNAAGHTPLHNAASFGRLKAVNLLLESGASPNACRKRDGNLHDGYTPLHSAVTYLGGSGIDHRIEVVRSLVRSGAKLSRTQDGYRPGTPLDAALDFQKIILHGYNPSENDRQRSAEEIECIIALLEELAQSAEA